MARQIPAHRSGGSGVRQKDMARAFDHLGKGYIWRPSWCPVLAWQVRSVRRAIKWCRRG